MIESLAPFESAITLNPIALSPLLIRRGGLLRRLIERWSEQLRAETRTSREKLNRPIPSAAEREALSRDLSAKYATSLMQLGLGNSRKHDTSLRELVGKDLSDLVSALDKDLTEIEKGTLDKLATFDACSVFEDEPCPIGERLSDIVKRRSHETTSDWKRVKRDAAAETQKLLEELRLDLDIYVASRTLLCRTLLHPCPRPVSIRNSHSSHRARMELLQKEAHNAGLLPDPPRFSPDIELVVDQAILLLRYELLEDITDAMDIPELAARGSCRRHDLDKHAKTLRDSLHGLTHASQVSVTSVSDFCSRMFAKTRVSAMQNWLSST